MATPGKSVAKRLAIQRKTRRKARHVPRYRIEMSEEQAWVVSRALELCARIGIGQFEEILHYPIDWFAPRRGSQFEHLSYGSYCTVDPNTARKQARVLLDNVHVLATGLPPNASLGIGNTSLPPQVTLAYEMAKVIEHRLSWDEQPQGGQGVRFYEPLALSGTPLPIIEKLPPKGKEAHTE